MHPNDVTTVVSFHIPFLVHLVDGSYEMKKDNHWIVFQLKRVNETAENTRKFFGVGMEFPQDAEIPKDRFGRLAHTLVSVFIPYRIMDDSKNLVLECPKCGIEISSTSTTCPVCEAKFTTDVSKIPAHSTIKKTAITLLNQFLEVYRFFSNEYHIEPIRSSDIVSFECDYMHGSKTYTGYKYLVDTGSGGIKSGAAFVLDDHIHAEFRDFLKTGKQIEIQEQLLCSAKNRLSTEAYPLALIEAVSALDVILSAFIRKAGSTAGIGKEAIGKFIHDVGVSGRVKVVLKLLTKGEEQLADEIYSESEGAITLRNKVIHEGFLNLDPTDVKRKVISIEKMIRYVEAISEKHS